MLLAIVAQRRTARNAAPAAAVPHGVDARILTPAQASSVLQPGAAALGRLDVADGLDGVEDGLWALGSLAARGVRVLNRAAGHTVLELNGAVDFAREYRLDRDPFVAAAGELARVASGAEPIRVEPEQRAAAGSEGSL